MAKNDFIHTTLLGRGEETFHFMQFRLVVEGHQLDVALGGKTDHGGLLAGVRVDDARLTNPHGHHLLDLRL